MLTLIPDLLQPEIIFSKCQFEMNRYFFFT